MSELHSELYNIFSYAFKMLKHHSEAENKQKVADEVIKFLEILKNQRIEQKLQHHDFSRDFYSWLAVQTFSTMLDDTLQSHADLMVDTYLQILEIHSPFDPPILVGVLNIFIESVSRSLGRNENYYKRRDDPLFFVKHVEVGNLHPECSEEVKGITVKDRDGVKPAIEFFIMIIEKCSGVIIQLDPWYIFEILSLFPQMMKLCYQDIGEKMLALMSQLILAVQPNNVNEWDIIYSSILAYYLQMQLYPLSCLHVEPIFEVINYITTFLSGFNHNLAELMFVVSLEVSYSLSQREALYDVSHWVSLSIKLLHCLDLKLSNFDSVIPKLVTPYHKEFFPLIEGYLVKMLENVLDSSLPFVENNATSSEEFSDCRITVVEQKSPIWRLCLNVLDRVSLVAYASDFFVKLIDYAALIISSGQRILYLLHIKFPSQHLEMFGSRCLRSLSAVPYMCNECLGDFCLNKYASLTKFVGVILGLFADCESHKLEDGYLVEHIFVLFSLPWNQQYNTQHIPEELKISNLNGILNLLFVMSPEKSLKYVAVLTSDICKKIEENEEVPVLKKFLSVLIILLFRASHDIVYEITCILKAYFSPEKIKLLLINEFVGRKMMCLSSNRCIVKRGPENWELVCLDCDAFGNKTEPPKFALSNFHDYIAVQFRDFIVNKDDDLKAIDIAKFYLRFTNHSCLLTTLPVIKTFFTMFVRLETKDTIIINEIISQLVYNNDGDVNKEIISAIHQTLCTALRGIETSSLEVQEQTRIGVLEVMKKLLLLPYPSEISMFKILMLHYYTFGGIGVCGIRGLLKMSLSSRDTDFATFCKHNEPQLAKFIVEFMIHKFHTNQESFRTSFSEVMIVLGYKIDDQMCGSPLMSSVLIEIIKVCDAEQSFYIILQLAELFLTDVKTFVEKHYENIFSEIYSLDDETVASKTLVPLFETCGCSLETTIYWKYSQLVCKLVLNSKHPLKIFRFLFHYKDQPGVNNSETQMEALKQHFIGCLTVVESTLTGPTSVSLQTAKNYIRCISNFIQILGSSTVTSIQVKLLTTLRTCLPLFYNTLPKHCLTAWVHFCFSVDLKKIGPYLPTILIHVLPLLDKFPDIVSNIFHYFIVEHGEVFRDQLPLLCFIPCHPNVKIQQVWCVIQSSLLGRSNYNRDILTTLENIYCESTETKIIALQHLRMCLKDYLSILMKSFYSCENYTSIFELILTCLLDNITHKNSDVKTLCGACLGELGAVDPMKFGINDVHKTYTPQKYNLKADDFSVQCITKIVHCLGKYDDSKTMGIFYSTIQELLQLQLLGKNDSQKFNFFNKFSTQDQYVLQPLLQTKYIFKGIKMDRNSSNPVSFGYHTVKTPCEWATIWASQMLARMPASFQKSVFTTCLPAMRIDMEVMEVVLPYILLYALLCCDSADVDLIEREMKYILQWDLSKHRTRPDNCMILVGESGHGVIHSDVSQTKYVAIILDLLDFVNQAVTDFNFFEASLVLPIESQDLEAKIKNFVDRFSPDAMSWKSFKQKDYCRSLYYIEKGSNDKINLENIKPLRNIYSKLNDIDGLVGVVKSSLYAPTMEETMVNHMVYGAVQDALSGFERLCTKYQSTNNYRALIQCYVNINQSTTALAVSSQIINDDKYLKPDIFSEHIEALWNSSHYEETDSIFDELDSSFLTGSSWNVDLVGIFRLLKKPKHADVLNKIKSIRLGIVNRLCDLNKNGMNLYRLGYWYMVKLHILNDIESLSQILFSVPPKGSKHEGFKAAWDNFDKRLALLPTHGPHIQDVMKSHLQTSDIVYNMSKLKLDDDEKINFTSHLGMMWLDLAKKARKKQCLQNAYTCIGIAEKYEPPRLFIELAKYHHAKFDTDGAVLVLQQGLNQSPALYSPNSNSDACKIYAKAKLLTALFNVSNMNLDFNDGYVAFKDAAEICNLEKSFVCLAHYLYRQHLTEAESDNTEAKRFVQLESARSFSKSLLYGTKHIYQSMPCVLSLWLDYGARLAKKIGSSKRTDETGMMKTMKDFNSLMENNSVCLPTFMFMTAFSQILSRINHRLTSCFDILKNIIIQIVQDYHQQAMWSFVSICRSNNPMQKKRTEEICKRIKSSNKELSRFFKVFNDFTDKLIDISLKKLKYCKKTNLSSINPHLRTLIISHRHVPIMLPLQKFLTVHISSSKSISDNKQHVPFPLTPVYISDVKDEVLILFSIQMPKRLEFVGSDGESHLLMCKKDDLRLDSRLMEFNSVINLLLRMDSVAQEKDLSIRTYSVVPLNNECGIIEWLSGLLSLKSIVTDMYAKLGVSAMPMSQIKKLMLVQKNEVEMSERLRRFVDVILPKHPPVLHKWFFERHPSPDAWYNCRSAFVKSAAVMSIVGYIVGLGDRHGENILIDSKSGEAVHVDFNCLFNRSDFLTFPETVPFRLTHSMVRAMGATGVEGLFVTSCEVTNRVTRHNSDQLLSVMKPFLYDIDVKPYSQRRCLDKDSKTDDQSNDEAKTNIQNVELRLSGVVRSKNDQFAPHRNSKPLSVEGQTRMLIKEATSNVNLCQMFAGWAPYM